MMVTLSRDQFHEVELVARDLGVTVRDDYVGRHAYGASCLALVTEHGLSELVGFVQAITRETESGELLDELADTLDRVRADQLGRGMVYYWPDVSVEP